MHLNECFVTEFLLVKHLILNQAIGYGKAQKNRRMSLRTNEGFWFCTESTAYQTSASALSLSLTTASIGGTVYLPLGKCNL